MAAVAYQSWLMSGRPRPTKEGKQALPVLAKPFRAVFSLIFGLIVVVPVAVERRQRLGGDIGPPPDAAPRRRRALLGESRGRRNREGGGEADQSDCLEHVMFFKSFQCLGSSCKERLGSGPCSKAGGPLPAAGPSGGPLARMGRAASQSSPVIDPHAARIVGGARVFMLKCACSGETNVQSSYVYHSRRRAHASVRRGARRAGALVFLGLGRLGPGDRHERVDAAGPAMEH